jgi:hypothetical protein
LGCLYTLLECPVVRNIWEKHPRSFPTPEYMDHYGYNQQLVGGENPPTCWYSGASNCTRDLIVVFFIPGRRRTGGPAYLSRSSSILACSFTSLSFLSFRVLAYCWPQSDPVASHPAAVNPVILAIPYHRASRAASDESIYSLYL